MFKLILMAVFTVSVSVYAQSVSTLSNTRSNSLEIDNLFSSVQSSAGNYTAQPELSDFKTKAQNGLDFMSPGSSILNLRCEKLTDWSSSQSETFHSYLADKYKDEINGMEPGWIKAIISEFSNKQCQFGIMHWEIVNNGISEFVKSIAIFDENWKVLFDTELVNFIVYSESGDPVESDNSSPDTSYINNLVSQTKSRSILLEGTFGSVLLHYQAKIIAFVPPYITASTNDAAYDYHTDFINCWRETYTGIPPNAEPFLYFGTGGDYEILYMNATPSESPITITGGSNDRFNTGLYNISGANGHNWSFSFDFSVDFPGGSIGITPISNISPLSLSADNNSSINMLNYVYNQNVAIGDVRAVFFNGGSLEADNFKILTGSGAGEIGKINITSKLRAGYMAPNVSGTKVPHFWNETSAAFNISVEYLRGDYVLQPAYQLTSTRYNIPIGQIDTLKAKIINNSHAVTLKGGNISIIISSLDNKLTLLSPATLPIGSIDTSASKEFKFVVRGNENGIVTPQIDISAMGWGLPVPPAILINTPWSIDSNIDVSPIIKTLTLTAPIQGFYNASSNSMIRDTVRVYLRDASSPYAIKDSAKAYLNTSAQGTFSFSKAVNFTQYFIQTRHRNSIETWSKTTQYFINSALSYDFSSANTQAYGDNLIQVDAVPLSYAIYNGEVNQDGTIDLNDVLQTYNGANAFAAGYAATDNTGDNIVDLNDVLISYNNSATFVAVVKP